MSGEDPLRASGPDFVPESGPDRRRTLWVMGVAGLALAAATASAANAARLGLRCIDGRLVAVRGRLLPAGERLLDDPDLPPLEVPAERCRDLDVQGREELEVRYLEATMERIDAALERPNDSSLESASHALGLVERLGIEEEAIGTRRQALLLAQLQNDLEQARALVGRVRAGLRAAEEAGVDPTLLAAIEGSLRAIVLRADDPVVAPPDAATDTLQGDPVTEPRQPDPERAATGTDGRAL